MNDTGTKQDDEPTQPADGASFRPHPIVWTREKSARFWNYMGPLFMRRGMYFSDHEGAALVDYVVRAGVPLSGRNLDFGCGPGYLIGHLIRRGIPITGVDFSSEAITQVGAAYAGNALFHGADLVSSLPTSFGDSSFDVVFLIETVEHLLDDDLDATIAELRRLVKPGGYVVVSTPNSQELWREEILCPDCGSIFHVTQHVRSWTPDSLTRFMASNGFRRERAEGQFFGSSRLRSFLLPRLKRRRPHLVYIGRRD